MRATTRRNRRELRDLQSDLVRYLVESYAEARRRMEADIIELVDEAAALRDAGRVVPRSWALRQEALERAVTQLEAELGRVHRVARDIVEGQRSQAVGLGQQHALSLIDEALGPRPAGVSVSLTGVPIEAAAQLAASSGPGTPLAVLFERLTPIAAERVRDALVTGMLTGRNARIIGRDLSRALGLPLARSITIARTEVLRAYRESSRLTYEANRGVVRGWQWVAALDGRTCIACIMMHGTIHQTRDVFGTHPRCRCAMVPVTASWAELGFEGIPDRRPRLEAGRDWFLRQAPAMQEQMLGPSKYAAWRDGAIDLEDIVRYHDHPTWGPTRSEASLKDMLGKRKAREYYPQAAD